MGNTDLTTRRRQELLDAVFRIVAARGLDEVSFRDVAAEAGVSIGTVQHYFPTKDQLLLSAMGHMVAQWVAHFDAMPAATVQEEMRREAHGMLPVDDRSVAGSRLWFAFTARSLVSPALGEAHAAFLREIHQHYAERLAAAVDRGELTAKETSLEAVLLLGLIDGLTMHALLRPGDLTPDLLRRALDRYLDRMFDVD
jgi:AcrR family transcriptional regulator